MGFAFDEKLESKVLAGDVTFPKSQRSFHTTGPAGNPYPYHSIVSPMKMRIAWPNFETHGQSTGKACLINRNAPDRICLWSSIVVTSFRVFRTNRQRTIMGGCPVRDDEVWSSVVIEVETVGLTVRDGLMYAFVYNLCFGGMREGQGAHAGGA